MSQPVLSVLRGRSSVLFRHAVLAVALCGSVQVATASTTVDQLSNCLVKSTTATDKTTVLQWTFAALAAHPDLKVYSNVTDAQRTQLDKNLAQVLQRILVEQCSAQTKAVIQAEGLQAVRGLVSPSYSLSLMAVGIFRTVYYCCHRQHSLLLVCSLPLSVSGNLSRLKTLNL